jgi:hypothetical protein
VFVDGGHKERQRAGTSQGLARTPAGGELVRL